jgi:hypothetical protein
VRSSGHALLRKPVAGFAIPFSRGFCLFFCSKTDVTPWDVERFLIVAHKAYGEDLHRQGIDLSTYLFQARFFPPPLSRGRSAFSVRRPELESFGVELS